MFFENFEKFSRTYSTLWIRAFVDPPYKQPQKLVSTGILLYENGHHQLLYLGHGGFAISSQKYNSVIFAVDFGSLKKEEAGENIS